ncbi:N-acetylmuramoyl-L-alanine amidase [Scopulibacillus darangshiensis]|uniref:N-acetylmuramoyl-L-alanine amidase n=1 Tax=Scopulibacillus darangshiensis TaxID=442528 RepID=A0A4R2NS15_9BACL|nr:N-acetylmuramoyl-L-alanine amidase CwlD [Scopulibacillus darangshiensis]TCP24198.1 N-acetylmuramoyl-L-alanine amidase [Scopulibacillus darangshiensis]
MRRKWVRNGIIIIGVILLIAILNYEIVNRNSWSQWNLPLSGRVIVIDPGHGGPDGGAEGGKTKEKDIALKISKDLRDYLQESGALVLMTRETDRDLADKDKGGLSARKTQDLKRRAKFIDDADPDCVISLHLNAIPSPRWRGAQTFYHPKSKENKVLAKFIQDSLRNQIKNTDRFAKAIEHVYLLKRSKAPSSLVEVGFLSNPDERQLLETKDYQKKIAVSIYNGILRYFTNEKEPSS